MDKATIESGWKVVDRLGTFPWYLQWPLYVELCCDMYRGITPGVEEHTGEVRCLLSVRGMPIDMLFHDKTYTTICVVDGILYNAPKAAFFEATVSSSTCDEAKNLLFCWGMMSVSNLACLGTLKQFYCDEQCASIRVQHID